MMRKSSIALIFVLAVATALPAAATLHSSYRRHSFRHAHLRVARWNPVLRGSHDSLLRQNEEIDRLKLARIATISSSKSLIAWRSGQACTIP